MAPKVFQIVGVFKGFFFSVNLVFVFFFHIVFFICFFGFNCSTTWGRKAQLNAVQMFINNIFKLPGPQPDCLSQGVRHSWAIFGHFVALRRLAGVCRVVLITFFAVWLLLLIKLTKVMWNFTPN